MDGFAAAESGTAYDNLIHGRAYWWFFGSATFDDIWGGRRILRFCRRYNLNQRVLEETPRERNSMRTSLATKDADSQLPTCAARASL